MVTVTVTVTVTVMVIAKGLDLGCYLYHSRLLRCFLEAR